MTTAASRLERAAEIRPGQVSDPDQVGAVDGEIGEPVRARQLALDDRPERPRASRAARGRAAVSALAAQVGLLVVEQIEHQAVAEARQQGARSQRVGPPRSNMWFRTICTTLVRRSFG